MKATVVSPVVPSTPKAPSATAAGIAEFRLVAVFHGRKEVHAARLTPFE
ncbi:MULTISPECIES: hypothetical protein [Natrialbaceae]|nr:hypothetical protein [Natronococcus sp. CG52]